MREIPTGLVGSMLDNVFVRDREVWIRGAAADGSDMTLCAYCARQCKEKCKEDYSTIPADQFAEYMDCECPVCWLYAIAVEAAELKIRLQQLESKA